MQAMDNDHERLSFQSRRSAATGFKEFNYVGLTLSELHSPSSVNHEEGLHLMLNPDMSRIPGHPGELSHQVFQDRQGLPVQEGIRHLYQAQHQQHHGLVDSACPSQQLAAGYSTPSDHMLEWKDTESIDDDCSIPISWMNGLLADPIAYRELEAQVQNSNQTFSDETEPHLIAAPHVTTTQSHGWLKNAMGDSVARASNSKNQSDLDIFGHGRLQLIPHSDTYTFASKIFGSLNRPHDHSTPDSGMSSCPNRRVINSNFDPTERTTHFGAAEYQSPLTHATLLRSNSVPAPETLISHEDMLAMHAQPNINLQLNFGGHGEVPSLQGARPTSPVQRLSYLQMGSESLLLHKQDDDSRSSGSVEHLNTHFVSGMPMDMGRRCSNAQLDSLPVESIIKLRPLDLATVLGASGRDVPNLHLRNVDGHDKNSEEDLTSEHAAMPVPAFMSNVPSVSKLNSSTAPSTSNVERLQSSKTDKLEAQSSIPPKKKKTAPRRSRFDPHDTPCTFVTERIRREKLTEKYNVLKSLIPRSTKVDRASIIEETIAHVQSLKCQIIHLEKVKQEKSIKMKRQKLDAAEGRDGLVSEQSGDVKCLWLKRTSRHGTEVDMRILQDEILVSIVQKHLPSFLLRMVTALESKLKLDIMNATGSLIDGFDVYNFRVKITGNSCGVGNEIMTNIIDTLDSAF